MERPRSASTNKTPGAGAGSVRHGEQPPQVSQAFLQTVMDSFPHCVIVLDLEYNIVLANRKARELAGHRDPSNGCVKCYQYAHHRDMPCAGTEEPCPLRDVVETKAPVRVYHTHHDTAGKRVYMAIDAAPIFDDSGEVIQVIESCRDVTERTLWRRILRIGNRHTEMRPLLQDFTLELENYTCCEVVGIRLRDEIGGEASYARDCPCHARFSTEERVCQEGEACICGRILNWEEEAKLRPMTRGGSIHVESMTEFLTALSDVFSVLSDDDGRVLGKQLKLCGCESLAIVPIVFHGRTLGVLHVADRRPNAISVPMVESLEELSMELSTAIQRVWSEEELRAARDGLESRVEQRTAELTRINRALQDEILERTRLEREILQISAKEQQRIGQELHDGLGQELTGLSYLAHSLYRKLLDKQIPESEKAGELAQGIPAALGQVRAIVKGLIPMEVTAAGIETALVMLVNGVEKQTSVRCRFERHANISVHDDYCAIQVYRIVQEAVNNSVKHAQPRQIVVALRGDRDRLRIEIRDDGIGIPPDAGKSAGCGMRIMRYRARAVGGTVDFCRLTGGGTLVACNIPQYPNRASRTRVQNGAEPEEIQNPDR